MSENDKYLNLLRFLADYYGIVLYSCSLTLGYNGLKFRTLCDKSFSK